MIRKTNFYLLIFLLVVGCSSVTKNNKNICEIFNERYFWYKHSKAAYQKWGVPIYIQLAFIKKESNFNWIAKPERIKLFKILPYKRKSSSLGYSQAIKGTWRQYENETGRKLATRMRYKDSVDFIGWYVHKTSKILKISKKDAYKQYLAYYLGWGDYKNYKKDKKAIIFAKSVRETASKYRKQLTMCEKNLNKKKFIIY